MSAERGSPTPAPDDGPAASAGSASSGPPVWRSEDLLAGHKEVFIQHGDETYRLRCTRHGKLILQK